MCMKTIRNVVMEAVNATATYYIKTHCFFSNSKMKTSKDTNMFRTVINGDRGGFSMYIYV